MLKRLLIVLICLLSSVAVFAQGDEIDCSEDGIAATVDAAVLEAKDRIAAGDDSADVFSDLEAILTDIQTTCETDVDMPADLTTSDDLGWQTYADVPQARLADGSFVLGNPDAEVTIVEFLDYACPHCQNYEPIRQQFIDEYVLTGKARYEVHVFRTAGGEMTLFVGEAVMCLEEQQEGAFWAAQDMLFDMAIHGKYNEDTPSVIANKLGLDYMTALECVSARYENGDSQVENDIEMAESLGAGGTPAIFARQGDDDPAFITYDGITYSSGGAPFEALAAAVDGEGLPI